MWSLGERGEEGNISRSSEPARGLWQKEDSWEDWLPLSSSLGLASSLLLPTRGEYSSSITRLELEVPARRCTRGLEQRPSKAEMSLEGRSEGRCGREGEWGVE